MIRFHGSEVQRSLVVFCCVGCLVRFSSVFCWFKDVGSGAHKDIELQTNLVFIFLCLDRRKTETKP